MLVGLELRLAHLSRAVGAVRIALESAEVRRSIPRTSIERAEEGLGRVDSKHAHAAHLSNTYMGHAHGAMRRNSHAREEGKPTGVKSQKSLCTRTREFAVRAHPQYVYISPPGPMPQRGTGTAPIANAKAQLPYGASAFGGESNARPMGLLVRLCKAGENYQPPQATF